MNLTIGRLTPTLKIVFFLFMAPSAIWAGVVGVSLSAQNNRNIAAGSIDNPILGLSVTLSGPDTFNSITVTNLGSAVTNTDITNVRVWYQTANGQFSPANATPVGVLNPTSPNSWQNPGNFNFAVNQNGKIFVTVDLLPGAQNGDTIQANLAANACVFTSGSFAAANITNTGVQNIQTGGATNLVTNNLTASTVSPGAVNVPVLHMKVTASGPDPLLFVTVNNLGTGLDATDIAAVKMWDQPAISGGGFDTTKATYVGTLNMQTSSQWKNNTQFQWSIDNNNGLWVTVDLKPTATGGRTLKFQTPSGGFQFGSVSLPSGPATNTGVQTIQAGTVQGVNMAPAPADVMLPGSVNNLVYQAVVTATGADILNTVLVNNTGTASSGGDIAAVNLWYQSGGGPFAPGTAVLLGALDTQGSFTWKNNTGLSASVANGDGLYVTVDLSASAVPNDTCVFQAPSAAFQFNSGSFAASAMTNPSSQTIVPPGQVTGLSLTTVPSGNIWQNSVGNLVLQVSVAANNADILQTLTVNNNGGNADEPTDLGNLTLWYQKGGGAFVPANSINLGTLNHVSTRQWQFTGINKVLSGDGLYVTTDVPAAATVGNTCDMGLASFSVNFQYGGTFPAASLTNPGTQTIVSPPTTSVALSNLPSTSFFQGTTNNPVLDLIVTGSNDTLTGFKAVQLGSASNLEVTAAKLWWQAGGGSFNAGTAVQLDTLTLAGGNWRSSGAFTNHAVANNDALFVTADLSASATIGHTFQMAVSTAGVTFLSSGSVPAAPVTNSGIQTISALFTLTPTRTFTSTFTATSTPTNTFTPTVTPTASMTATPSLTATASPTPTATNSATSTVTSTPSNSPTFTSTATNTATLIFTSTPTSTPTNTFTFTSSVTSTPTNTFTFTVTPTPTASMTATPSLTATASPTPTATNSATSTVTATPTNTFSFTPTPTNTPTSTPTNTFTVTSTITSTATNTGTSTPTNTFTFTATRTNTPTDTVTSTYSPTFTATSTSTFTSTPTNSFTNTATFVFTATPTSTPTKTGTSTFTSTFTSTATSTATNTGTATASMTPTASLTATPSTTPTNSATSTATRTATSTPTDTATLTASSTATSSATSSATRTPTSSATATLTFTATNSPTASMTPTASLTATPTATPSNTRTSTNTPTPTNSFTPTNTRTITDTPTLTNTFTPVGSLTATPTPDDSLYLDNNYFDPTKGPLGMDVRVFADGNCKVMVFNMSGQQVVKLVDQVLAAGNYRFNWDGTNSPGTIVGNGVYFFVVVQPSGNTVKKVIVLK